MSLRKIKKLKIDDIPPNAEEEEVIEQELEENEMKLDPKEDVMLSLLEEHKSEIVLPFLPGELLVQIFTYLPLKDRKNIRLTCKWWNKLCNGEVISKMEKLMICGVYKTEKVVEYLSRSKRVIHNLEFHAVEMHLIPSSIWENCGNRIRSIFINHCELNSTIFKTILGNTTFLEKLIYREKPCPPVITEKLLDELIENRFHLQFVVTLELILSTCGLENYFDKLFQVFPHIKNFTKDWLNCSHDLHAKNFTLVPQTLKKLSLISLCGDHGGDELLKYLSSGKKLIELVIDISYTSTLERTLRKFFRAQTELRVLKMSIFHPVNNFMEELLCNVLKNCPKLQELYIKDFYNHEEEQKLFVVHPSEEQIGIFMSESDLFFERISQLHTFCVDYDIVFPESTSFRLAKRRNTKLKILRFPQSVGAAEKLLQFNCFPDLEGMEFDVQNLEILDKISEFQNLRILDIVFHKIDENSDALIKRLLKLRESPEVSFEKLEHLTISGGAVGMLYIFGKYRFPRLKHFDVCLDPTEELYQLNEEFLSNEHLTLVLNCIPARAPNLEIIRLSRLSDSIEIITEFIARMPKLEILEFDISSEAMILGKELKDAFDRVFSLCPTLRFVIYRAAVLYYHRMWDRVEVLNDDTGKGYLNLKSGPCCKLIERRRV